MNNQDKYFVKMFACIPPPYGGLCVYAKRLSLDLTKHGLLSGAFYHESISGIPADYLFLYDAMPKHARSFYVLPELYKLLAIFKRYKIIHSHLYLGTCMTLWLVRKLLSKPVVMTIHNQMIDRELEDLNYFDRKCLKSLFNDKFVQVITVNENGRNLLMSKGFKFANSIKVLPAYIAPVEIGKPGDYLSRELISFIDTHPRYIVFYAESFAYYNNNEIYGTKECINAFTLLQKEMTDLALVFCMPNMNDENKLSELKQLVIEQGCNDRVFWQLKGVSEMWPLLKQSVLYLRPTSTDGDSVLLREALGLGVQSLASDIVKRPIECKTYKWGDQEDLVSKMRIMLNQKEKPVDSQKDYFSEMLDIYKELLHKSNID